MLDNELENAHDAASLPSGAPVSRETETSRALDERFLISSRQYPLACHIWTSILGDQSEQISCICSKHFPGLGSPRASTTRPWIPSRRNFSEFVETFHEILLQIIRIVWNEHEASDGCCVTTAVALTFFQY